LPGVVDGVADVGACFGFAEDYGLPEDELRHAPAYEWDTSDRQAA
jgi:hypothetical protein